MPGSKFDGANINSGRSIIAGTTGVGTAIAFHDCKQIFWTTQPSAVPLTGIIVIEANMDPTATNGWWQHEVIDVAFLGSSGASGSTQGAGSTPPLGGPWFRANITTPIVGGNVTVFFNGLQAD